MARTPEGVLPRSAGPWCVPLTARFPKNPPPPIGGLRRAEAAILARVLGSGRGQITRRVGGDEIFDPVL